jgi:hypothetical protein
MTIAPKTKQRRPPHRPSYRCSRCGEHKRGHLCIFEQHVQQQHQQQHQQDEKQGEQQQQSPKVDAVVQVEMDMDMTVRALALVFVVGGASR